MNRIVVIGAGTMGNGIAQVFAMKGFSTTMVDVSAAALEKGMANIRKSLERMEAKETITAADREATLARLSTATDLADAAPSADLIVEAATENVDIKLSIFRQADALAPAHTILASNTSSISITKIASVTSRPDKVIGMHFMNPVPIMKLIEVINGYATSAETTQQILTLSEALGKIPVPANDYPGFVANRILMPMINEAIQSLFEGVAGVAEIDTVMKLGMAHPMGPLQLADFIGLDVCLSILNVLYQGFGQGKYAPCPLLVNMVMAGKLGVKSGEGFYNYSGGTKTLVVASQFTK